MTTLYIPHSRINIDNLPTSLYTGKPDSFAYNTMAVRVPRILRDVIDATRFPETIRLNLEELYVELIEGVVRGLQENTPDRTYWDTSVMPYLGHSWLDLPWFWAEAYFYRRILEATHYFQPGPTHGFDPFSPIKQKEWLAAPKALDALLATLPEEQEERFERLLHASLWGNRIDLSLPVAAHLGSTRTKDAEQENLLVDDTQKVWEYLNTFEPVRIAFASDNSGTELLMDLALADFLLTEGLASTVSMHLKMQPYFVSDTMPKDVHDGIETLRTASPPARSLADRLQTHLAEDRLLLSTHWFYVTDLFYFQLPEDLQADLATNDLVIVKGDANYRRLLGDATWPYDTSFAEVIAYFPSPLVALRTFKGPVAVGLPPGEAERIQHVDSDWLINGKRGVIQSQLS